MNQAMVGLGANISDPLEQLTAAHYNLAQHSELAITATSSVYVSPPHGPQDQPDFFNAVVKLATSLAPDVRCWGYCLRPSTQRGVNVKENGGNVV